MGTFSGPDPSHRIQPRSLGVTFQTPHGCTVAPPLTGSLSFIPECAPGDGPRLSAAAGREEAWGYLAQAAARERRSRFSGRAAAAALSLLLSVVPEGHATLIVQSSSASDDFRAGEARRSWHFDNELSSGAWWVTPLGAPVLPQPTKDWSQRGVRLLSPGEIASAPVPSLEPSATALQPETLEQVLRSMTTVHPQFGSEVSLPNVRPQQGAGSQATDHEAQDRGLSELLLQSETAGVVLRAVVDLNTVDEHGVTSSIFGIGNFELDEIPDTHNVLISELSNGWSATFSGPVGAKYSADPTRAADDGASPRPKHNFLRLAVMWVLDFLTSPIGILFAILSGLVMLVWAAISTVAAVRGTPSRHRRAFRRTRLDQEVTESARPRRRRRAVARHRRSRRRFGRRAPQV